MQIRPIDEAEIGGGYVRRPGGLSTGGAKIANGAHLSREWLLGIPKASRNALVSVGYVELYPMAPAQELAEARKPSGVRAERMVHKQVAAAL